MNLLAAAPLKMTMNRFLLTTQIRSSKKIKFQKLKKLKLKKLKLKKLKPKFRRSRKHQQHWFLAQHYWLKRVGNYCLEMTQELKNLRKMLKKFLNSNRWNQYLRTQKMTVPKWKNQKEVISLTIITDLNRMHLAVKTQFRLRSKNLTFQSSKERFNQ